jgi:hypothetical protein
MPISDHYEFNVNASLEPGIYDFVITDIELKQLTDNETHRPYNYLHFKVVDNFTQEEHDNLLSVPFNIDKETINTKSKLARILKKFGIDVREKNKINAKTINSLINNEFSARISEENGFSKILINTIETKKETKTENN